MGLATKDPQKVALAGLITNEQLGEEKMTPNTLSFSFQ